MVGILLVTLSLFTAISVAAQGTASKDSTRSSSAEELSTSKRGRKPNLAEVTHVSTTEAARSAAQEATKKKGGSKAAVEPAEADVIEFRPAAEPTAAAAAAAVPAPKDSKKAGRLAVHGTTYGSIDPQNSGTHRTGGSVGVGSKSGKSHVYVETERTRTTLPSPR